MKKKGDVNVPLIMIVTISVLVIGLAYLFFSNSFENLIHYDSSQNIEETTINLGINKVYEENGNLAVDVVRNAGEGQLTGIKFILSAGANSVETIIKDSSIHELERETFILTPTQLSLSEIKNVFIVPIFESSNGKKTIGKITDQNSFSFNGSINPVEETCTPNCVGLQCGLDSVCGQLCGECDGTHVCSNGLCITKNCIPNNNITTCGSAKCGTKTNNCGQQVNCGSCQSGNTCNSGTCVPSSTISNKNTKDLSKYFSKNAFLVSDEDWKQALILTSVTIWTNNDNSVTKYPLLIYHKENEAFDIDSIYYFFKQYTPNKISYFGSLPIELKTLLQNSFNIEQKQNVLEYWTEYKDVVYVEDNYELALLASTYASLINAPLIIKGYNDNLDLSQKNVICVGNPTSNCKEKYSLEQLQQQYMIKTNTDKIVLLNPDDLSKGINAGFKPEKSTISINQVNGKTSLVASTLAAAKHELLIFTHSTTPIQIKSDLIAQMNKVSFNLINPMSSYSTLEFRIIELNLTSNKKTIISKLTDVAVRPDISEDTIVWAYQKGLGNQICYFNRKTQQESCVPESTDTERDSPQADNGYLTWWEKNSGENAATARIYLYNLQTGEKSQIFSSVSTDFAMGSGKVVSASTTDYGLKVFDIQTKTETNLNKYGTPFFIYNNLLLYRSINYKLYSYNLQTKEETEIKINADFVNNAEMYENKIAIVATKDSFLNVFLYDTTTQSATQITQSSQNNPLNLNEIVSTGNNFIAYSKHSGTTFELYTYNINTQQNQLIGIVPDNWGIGNLEIYKDTLIWDGQEPYTNKVFGFLTIIGMPFNAIPISTNDNPGGQENSLDETYYSDILGEDRYADLFTGRIIGLTVSDASQMIARGLFFDTFNKNNKVVLYALGEEQGGGYVSDVQKIRDKFLGAGYDVTYKKIDYSNGVPSDWENEDLIFYAGHGASSWQGLSSDKIPQLSNSLFISQACQGCMDYTSPYSFCLSAIRKGAFAISGSISNAGTGMDTQLNTLNGVYYYNYPLGQAFTYGYEFGYDRAMHSLFADPTIVITPRFKFTNTDW